MKFPDVVSNTEKSFLMLSEQGMMHSWRRYNFPYFESMLKDKNLVNSTHEKWYTLEQLKLVNI